MARQTLKQKVVDEELLFSFAKCGDKHLGDIESFISDPNQADLLRVGDRCYEHKLF